MGDRPETGQSSSQITGYRWLGAGPFLAIFGAVACAVAVLLLPFWTGGGGTAPTVKVFLLKLEMCRAGADGVVCNGGSLARFGADNALWMKLALVLAGTSIFCALSLLLVSGLNFAGRLAKRLWLCNAVASMCLFAAALAIWMTAAFDGGLAPSLSTLFTLFGGLGAGILGVGFIRMKVSRMQHFDE